jgi:hypothetical protein
MWIRQLTMVQWAQGVAILFSIELAQWVVNDRSFATGRRYCRIGGFLPASGADLAGCCITTGIMKNPSGALFGAGHFCMERALLFLD